MAGRLRSSVFMIVASLAFACGPETPATPGVEVSPSGTEVPGEPGKVSETPIVNRPDTPRVPYEPKDPEDPKDPETFPKACSSLYDPEVLQDFHVQMDPADWARLEHEHENVEALRAAGKPVEVYRPVTKFEHAGLTSTEAMIRLRGNPSSWPKQDKMQFQISFNELNPDGRFRGQRKLVLDSAHYNPSYLRDRLAMKMLQDVGVPAPCVNHARLFVNGQFYGLFANIEKVDREFLERNFEDPSGNLWKRGTILKTNEDENPDTSRNDAFWELDSISGFEDFADVDNAAVAWAAEALFPDADGYWAGGWNFYWYEDPSRGFVYIPWDIDLAFANLPSDTDPLTWHKTNDNFHGRPHVDLVLADPVWRAKFVDAVETVRDSYTLDEIDQRIEGWADQIEDAAAMDSHAPWTFSQHKSNVVRLRNYVKDRSEFIDGWLTCVRQNGNDSSVCR